MLSLMRTVISAAIVLSCLACGASQETNPGQPIHVEAPAPAPVQVEPPAQVEQPAVPQEQIPPGVPQTAPEDDLGGECEADADCVPASCCHPTSCVPVSNRPSCDRVMCTQECRGGTLDCGGSCVCANGRCLERIQPHF